MSRCVSLDKEITYKSFRILFLLQLKPTGPIGDLGMAAVRAAAEEDPAEGAHASVDVLRAALESVLTKGCVTATLAQVGVSLSYSYHTHNVFLAKGLFTAEASWSTWGSWSSCTKTCGRGRSDRYRSCSGGSTCPGDGSEARWCNNNSCPGHLTKQSCLPIESTSLYLS